MVTNKSSKQVLEIQNHKGRKVMVLKPGQAVSWEEIHTIQVRQKHQSVLKFALLVFSLLAAISITAYAVNGNNVYLFCGIASFVCIGVVLISYVWKE